MRHFLIFVMICASGLLAACGQKGPLVLPDSQKHKPTTANPVKPLTTAPAAPAAPASTTPTTPPAAVPSSPAADAGTQSKDDKPSETAATP
jgi:predicted small lipoprotein YifL